MGMDAKYWFKRSLKRKPSVKPLRLGHRIHYLYLSFKIIRKCLEKESWHVLIVF